MDPGVLGPNLEACCGGNFNPHVLEYTENMQKERSRRPALRGGRRNRWSSSESSLLPGGRRSPCLAARPAASGQTGAVILKRKLVRRTRVGFCHWPWSPSSWTPFPSGQILSERVLAESGLLVLRALREPAHLPPQFWGLRGKCTPEVCPSHLPPGT